MHHGVRAPAGIITGPDIARSLKDAPRKAAVEMTNQHVRRSSPDVLVLAHKATREGADPYAAYCTSTYRRESDRWRLIQHQQTPT
jgi:hypothetical protein